MTTKTARVWKMTTWSNKDGTGTPTRRLYVSRASAVRAADRLRARGVVAHVEHVDAQAPVSHWRS